MRKLSATFEIKKKNFIWKHEERKKKRLFLKIHFIYYDTEQMMWLELVFTPAENIGEMIKHRRTDEKLQTSPPPQTFSFSGSASCSPL